MKKTNVLIVDDRPMVIAGIQSALHSQDAIVNSFTFETSNCYEEAIHSIKKMKEDEQSFDLIISDVDLKKCDGTVFDYNDKEILNLKKEGERSKLITIIRSKDNYRIYKILRTVRPDGFILETELNTSNLVDLVKSVLNESVYYSKSIFNILNTNQATSLILDDIDREILYLLSKGVKTKNLTKYIARSLSALEKRKQRIKDLLVMDNCSDGELIEKASIQKLV